MSEKYKTDADGLYFVSFSVVGWMDACLPAGRFLQEENIKKF